jgi:hypothetical protein
MPKFLIATSVIFSVITLAGGHAYATPIKEEQVNNICQGSLQSGSAGSQKAKGCEKMCGSKICTYGCIGPKNKSGYAHCDAEVVGYSGQRAGWKRVVSMSRFEGATRKR